MLTGALGWLTDSAASLFLFLLVIRSLAGVCNAPLHPGAAHVVSELFSHSGRASANGIITAGALIGIAFCYPVLGWLMDRFGWQMAFVVSGGCLVAYAMLWRALTLSGIAAQQSSMVAQADSDRQAGVSSSGWALLGDRDLWLLALSYAAYGYFQYLFFYWMDYYFKTVLHVPAIEARWASFWIMLAQGLGMAVGGVSTDRVCRRLGTTRGRRFIVMTAMGCGAMFGLLGVNVTGRINVAMCLALAMGALGVCEGVFWTKATEVGGRSRGFSAAFMNTGGNIGGLISPVLTPAMAERMGWPGAITVACIIAGLGGAVWFLMKRPEPEPAYAASH
jgi:MFS family permease